MSKFTLSNTVNKDKMFLVSLSEIKGRLEPKFYTDIYIDNEKRVTNSKYEIRHLGEVTNLISDGTHFTPKYKKEGIKFISVKDVRKSKISLNETKFISVEEADKLDKRCKPQKGDVLLTKIGATFGFASVVNTDERFQIFVSLALLRPDKEINPHYLEVYLNTNLAYLQYHRVIKGAGVPDLHLEDIRKIKIPIPNSSVQKDIVKQYYSILDISKQKENKSKELLFGIDNYLLKELGITLPVKDNSLSNRIFETSLSHFAGVRFDAEYHQVYYSKIIDAIQHTKFSLKKIKEIISFIESGSRPKGGVGNIKSGVFSIGGEHVNNKCEVGTGKPKYIPAEFHAKYLYTETKLNDVILVKDGATTGKIGIIENELFANQNINEHVFLIRPEQAEITPLYLTYFLHTKIGQILLKREITGATVTGLTKEAVKSIEVPVPPIEKQNEIAEHIKNIRQKAKQLQTEAIEILENAKQKVEEMILEE